MQFNDSEVQSLLRDTARSYLADKFPWSRLYALESNETPLGSEEIQGLAHLGWFGLLIPEPAGGAGLSLMDAAVVLDELGYAAVPLPVGHHNAAAWLLARAGGANQDALTRRLRRLARGDEIYTVNEAARRRARLTRAGAPDDRGLVIQGGRLRGMLPMVPFADMAHVVVTPLTMDGEHALAAVPLAGARLERTWLLDRAVYFNVHLENVPASDVLVLARGAEAEVLHDQGDALLTAFSLIEQAGLARRTLEMTTEYISNRVQFGQPIGKFQAARHRAVDLYMHVEGLRWSAYYGLWRFQEDPNDSSHIWLAKHWAERATVRIYEDAHMLHGGVGVGMEFPLHLLTLPIAATAVRAGGATEAAERVLEWLRAPAPAGKVGW